MKRIIIIAALILSLSAQARDWGRVLKAIAYVESNGNPRAVSGDQVGLLQIRPIMVRDCNRILEKRGSSKRYSLRDRYNPVKSREMFVLYQSHYNPHGDAAKYNGRLAKTDAKATRSKLKRFLDKVFKVEEQQ